MTSPAKPSSSTPSGVARLRGMAPTLLALCLAATAATGCRAGSGVDAQGYREDERALLQITLDGIVEQELKKDYASLYDEYASKSFRERVPARRFLKLTNCVETHLGAFLSYDRQSAAFKRERQNGVARDHLNLRAFRENGLIIEQFVFTPEGLSFKMSGVRWLSQRPAFLECVRAISQTPDGTLEETMETLEDAPAATSPAAATAGDAATTTPEAAPANATNALSAPAPAGETKASDAPPARSPAPQSAR